MLETENFFSEYQENYWKSTWVGRTDVLETRDEYVIFKILINFEKF
jgi:hypothetical protein